MADDKAKTPKEIADGAMDRICAYDLTRDPYDYEETMERVAEFVSEFIRDAAHRLAQVALKEERDGALADIEEALKTLGIKKEE